MLETLKSELKKAGLKMNLSTTKLIFNENQKMSTENQGIERIKEQIHSK